MFLSLKQFYITHQCYAFFLVFFLFSFDYFFFAILAKWQKSDDSSLIALSIPLRFEKKKLMKRILSAASFLGKPLSLYELLKLISSLV